MTLSREYVEKVAREEALKSRCTFAELIHMCQTPEAKAARVRAWARVISETGCKASELAKAWGCDRHSIYRAFPPSVDGPRAARAVAEKPVYDLRTLERLSWAHGRDRAQSIVAGRDIATETDIARWRTLGAARA